MKLQAAGDLSVSKSQVICQPLPVATFSSPPN
jgi:hypothetical protein